MCIYGIFDLVIKLFPIFISIASGVVAYAQYITQKNKLKLDLYNRRFAVYENTINYCDSVLNIVGDIDEYSKHHIDSEDEYEKYVKNKCKEFTDDKHLEFLKSFRETLFLFGENSEVYKSLYVLKKEIYKFVEDKIDKNVEIEFNPDEVLNKNIKTTAKREELRRVIEKRLVLIEKAMKEWLDFTKI